MQLLMFCLSEDEMCNTSFLFHFLLLVIFKWSSCSLSDRLRNTAVLSDRRMESDLIASWNFSGERKKWTFDK